MAGKTLVDTGFIVALLSSRDRHHSWAVTCAQQHPPPWSTCEATLSETFHLLGSRGGSTLATLIQRGQLGIAFDLTENISPVLKFIEKYREVPMSLADACLVRMTETLTETVLLTTDSDFHIYRRHGRQVIPCVTPQ